MSCLFRHTKTSTYWFHRWVPANLRPIVGKLEVKRSLGMTEVREAKRLALTLAAEVDDLFVAAGKTASELSVTAPVADGRPLSSVGAGAGLSAAYPWAFPKAASRWPRPAA